MQAFGWGNLIAEASPQIVDHNQVKAMRAIDVFFRILHNRVSNRIEYKMNHIISELANKK